MTELDKVADAIDAARFAHPQNPRERPRAFADADPSDREYAIRLARAVLPMISRSVVLRIADVSEAVGWQAGVGGMETAGMIVSALSERPELVERFLAEGTGLMLEGEIMPEKGRLTFHRSSDGKVTTPQELRAAIVVKNMERGKPAEAQRG